MNAKRALAYLICLSACCLSTGLVADEVRPAYLQISEKKDQQGDSFYAILWKQPAVQSGRLAISPQFPEGCLLKDEAAPEITSGAFIQRWTTRCELNKGLIHIDGLSVTLTDVMVRIEHLDGESKAFILRPENPSVDLSDPTSSTMSYLRIGFEHLLAGLDHVLFVVGLVLFIRDPWLLIKTVTAFTLSHSITLALSISGWVQVGQGPVEAVIALSILFLARELAMDTAHRSRLTQSSPWIMAFLFGLLHGLGFAGALRDVGLPQDTLWQALLLFNVGIELGQLLVILFLSGIIWIAARFTQLDKINYFGAMGMGCLAACWTIDRTLLLL